MRQQMPKMKDAIIIERERFLSLRNSPKYAKRIEVEPDMHMPLTKRKNIICHKLTDKLDMADAIKADREAVISIFFLPYASERNPQICDVKMMPRMQTYVRISYQHLGVRDLSTRILLSFSLSIFVSSILTCKPNTADQSILRFRRYFQVAFGNWQHITHATCLEKCTSHEYPRNHYQTALVFAKF
jgi:hypothetical protein